jgi:hypothetical protein
MIIFGEDDGQSVLQTNVGRLSKDLVRKQTRIGRKRTEDLLYRARS